MRLWAEHLELDESRIADVPAHRIVDEHWRTTAFEQLGRAAEGRPPTHRLLALPGVSKRSGRLLGPLVGLLDDG